MQPVTLQGRNYWCASSYQHVLHHPTHRLSFIVFSIYQFLTFPFYLSLSLFGFLHFSLFLPLTSLSFSAFLLHFLSFLYFMTLSHMVLILFLHLFLFMYIYIHTYGDGRLSKQPCTHTSLPACVCSLLPVLGADSVTLCVYCPICLFHSDTLLSIITLFP